MKIELRQWRESSEGQAHIQAKRAECATKKKKNNTKGKRGSRGGCGNDNPNSLKKQKRSVKKKAKEIEWYVICIPYTESFNGRFKGQKCRPNNT